MTYIHRNTFEKPTMFRIFGEAISILLNSERKRISIAAVGAFVFPYARLGQIKIFYGSNSYPAAYMTWAYVTDEIISNLRENPTELIDIEDMNAGDNLLLTDMLSNLRSVRPIIEFIRYLACGNYEKIYALRYCRRMKKMTVKAYPVSSARVPSQSHQ